MVAERLREGADLLSRQSDNSFRVSAYRRADETIAGLPVDLRTTIEKEGVQALEQFSGVGKRISAAIAELAATR